MPKIEGGQKQVKFNMEKAERSECEIINLCRACNNALRNGNYIIRHINPSEIKTIRQCGFCGQRTFCGLYELGPGKQNKQGNKNSSEIIAEEIAEEIKDRNL